MHSCSARLLVCAALRTLLYSTGDAGCADPAAGVLHLPPSTWALRQGACRFGPFILQFPISLWKLNRWANYHYLYLSSPQEKKAFDEKFVRLDTRRLCELTSAADALDMRVSRSLPSPRPLVLLQNTADRSMSSGCYFDFA